MKKSLLIVAFLLAALAGFVCWKCGFYSIQPIGALPEGATWLVWRDAETPYFDSADALCLRRVGSVSLLARGLALGQAPKDKIIARFPFWHFAYLKSTHGQEFEK